MNEKTDISENEVKEILNTKIEKLGELELFEDDEPVEHPEVIEALKAVPAGREGMEKLARSKPVQNAEQQLSQPQENEPSGLALKESLTQMTVEERTEKYKQEVQLEFKNAVEVVEKLYGALAKGLFFSNKSLLKLIRRFMEIFKKDQNIIINFFGYDSKSEEYLYSHALRVSLCTMNLAAVCGFSEEQVEEVGAAALLADIGMLFVPDEIRFKNGKLSRAEFFEIQKHPMMGIAIIEKIVGINPRPANAAYQHHERLRGIGYPKTRKGPLILQYTRLMSIADVFEALCSRRNHRKAYSPHASIIMLMKMAAADILDRELVREFVRSISLYPIGSMVKLSDGRLAKVIESCGKDIKSPVVSVLTDTNGKLLSQKAVKQINLLQEPNIKIETGIEALNDVRLMDGF